MSAATSSRPGLSLLDLDHWEEHLRVLQDCDADEMKLHELVAVTVAICEDEFCESCDTVYAWGGETGHPDIVQPDIGHPDGK